MIIPRADGVVNNRETSTGMATGATGFAVQAAGAAMGLASEWNKQRDHAALQEALNASIKKKNDWKAANLTRQGKDAEGLTEDYLKFSQETESELSRNLTANAKNDFLNWSLRDTESDKLSVMMHQKKQEDFVKQSAFADGVTLAEETVRTNAKDWQKGFEHLTNSLELAKTSGVIPEEQFETKKTEYVNRYRTELGKAYYTQDRHEFMKNINEFGFGEPEIAAYQQKYKNDLKAEERERKSLFSEEAKLLYGQKEDMKAQAIANSDASHFFESAKKLESMGYKDWARDLKEEGNLYTKTIEFNDQYKNAPLAEKYQAAQALKVPNELDGSGIQYKANQTIKKEMVRQVKQFNSDPAQFVSAFAQGSNMEEIASSRISLQNKQGIIPEKGFKVLTGQEAKSLKGAWEAGDVKQRTQVILDIGQYGKYAPKVLSEMEVEGALTLAPHVENQHDLEVMVAAAADKDPKITSGVYKMADYTSRAQDSKFNNLLAKVQKEFPTDSSLSKKMESIQKVMIGIGTRKVDPSAGPEFFDKHFNIEEGSDKLVYFPKSIDPDEVLSALDSKKKTISESFKSGDKNADLSARWAVRDMKWVNTPSGFILADPKSGRALPGSRIDFDELSDDYRQKMAKKKSQNAPAVTVNEKVNQFIASK